MFGVKKLSYEFASPNGLSLHARIPTITFRGAFGYALAQVIARYANISTLEDQVSLYRRIFMPLNEGDESRNQDLARPFVMRGYYSRPDKRSFILELLLFGIAGRCESFFDTVVDVMARMRIGKLQTKCYFVKVGSEVISMPDPEPSSDLAVEFLTPCVRMKHLGWVYRDEIPFHVLLPRLVDRVMELDTLYGDGSFGKDGQAVEWKRQSASVASVKLSGGTYRSLRTSGRTGQQMRLDGFVGEMQYTGDFSPFREVLRYLPWVNLGHFNVFGCGWCRMNYI